MKSNLFALFAGAVAILVVAGTARAQDQHPREFSVMGGLQELNKNDTAFPVQVVTVPASASYAYHFNEVLAAGGEVTWMIPVQQPLNLPTGASVNRKAPDVVTYQANLRASLPLASWTPYITGGAGAMTVLQSTDPSRLIQLAKPQTAFAVNFGAGATFPIAERFGIRADLREFAAFPSQNAQGLSLSGNANSIWMERGQVGLYYRF